MGGSSYFRFLHEAIRLYNHDQLERAYELVLREGEDVGGNPAQILNLKYCLESRLGKQEAALETFRGAVGQGYWYGYEYLLQDEDLRPIRDTAEFRRLAEVCRGREMVAKARSRPDLKVLPSERGGSKGLLLALHGNGDSVSLNEGYWSQSTELGFALALPQSSQTTSWDTYTWNDLEVGRRELLQHMAKLRDDGLLWDEKLVLGGFSGGARLALLSILRDEARPSGFILMAPWLPELEEWGPMFSGLAGRGLRGFIICGEKDEQCLGNAIKASGMLNHAGADTDLQVVEGLDHDFPEDFERRLADMLAILG